MNKKLRAVAVGLVILLAACGGSTSESTTSETTTTVETTTTEATTTTVAPTTTRRAASINDFVVELIVLESKCFNSAGALVTVEPELYSDASGSYTIVYEVHGGEAVETFNLELTDDGNYSYRNHVISTASCDDELAAEVVRVIER